MVWDVVGAPIEDEVVSSGVLLPLRRGAGGAGGLTRLDVIGALTDGGGTLETGGMGGPPLAVPFDRPGAEELELDKI